MGAGGEAMTRRLSFRPLLAVAAATLLAGCAQKGPPPLYAWENFPRQQYEILLRFGASPAEQLQTLQAHVESARAGGRALPPGLRAHMGLLQLSLGNVSAAREMWQAEKAAFPESSPYIDQLIKRLDAPAPTSQENPA